MAAQGRDARALANATVAAIGPGTAAALAEHGVIADVVPERFVAEALVEALAGVDVARPAGARRPRRRGARRAPRRARRARREGRRRRALRDGRARTPSPAAVEAAAGADYVTFTSSSTVRNLLDAVGDRFPRRRPGRLDRPGHQRRPPARPGSRSTSRPSATTRRAWSRRWSPMRAQRPDAVRVRRSRCPRPARGRARACSRSARGCAGARRSWRSPRRGATSRIARRSASLPSPARTSSA